MHLEQGDNTREVHLVLLCDGVPFDVTNGGTITGIVYTIKYIKSNGIGGHYEETSTGEVALEPVTGKTNEYTVRIDEHATDVPGFAEIFATFSLETGEQLHSFGITLDVEQNTSAQTDPGQPYYNVHSFYVMPETGIPASDLAPDAKTFWVTITRSDSTYASDKTLTEIRAARTAGAVVRAKLPDGFESDYTVDDGSAIFYAFDPSGGPLVLLQYSVGASSVSFASLPVGGGGLSDEAKLALLALLQKVAYIDDDGQDYYDALEAALYPVDPPASLSYITAVYEQDRPVYDTDSLDVVKLDLVVTAHYSDGTSEVVTNYTLSGTLTAGTSTITVSYGGKTATFTVTVTPLYQRCEWIESSGTQIIITDFEPSYNDLFDLTLTVDALLPSSTTAATAMFAGVSSWAGQWIGLMTNGKIGLGQNIGFSNVVNSDRNTFELSWTREPGNHYCKAECGEETIQRNTSDDRALQFALFANHTKEYWASVRVFGAQWRQGDTVVRNYEPHYRTTDGEIGILETVSGTFYANEGTGEFTKGADV